MPVRVFISALSPQHIFAEELDEHCDKNTGNFCLVCTGWWLEAERNTVKVFQDCSPSVANISTSTTANIGMSMNPIEIPRGTGSAFVWDTNGHVVTNYHVVMNGNKAKITLSDASTWEGAVVGVAKNKDLAVLKISAPASLLKPIVVGSSQV